MYGDLYNSLLEIVNFFNRPKQDKLLLQKAGISLDTALFPLLMRIFRYGSLGIVELAGQVGRDHSTISRQIDRLIALGLVAPTNQITDKRMRKVGLTGKGKTIANQVSVTRRMVMREALQDWDEQQLAELRNSLEHLADTISNYAKK